LSSIPLYIFGSAGYAHEVAAYVRAIDVNRVIVFVEREPSAQDCISVAEYRTRIGRGEPGESILGSGRCDVRRRMIDEMLPPFATFIHPSAVVLGEIGAGCVIAPNAVVAPHTKIAEHVLVNYNATVGHDTVVDRLCVIGPTAAIGGYCRLEERVYIGAGALVREKLTLHAGATIGMGAVVTKDVRENAIIAGVPGREMNSRQSERGWL
jgi:sugar O-acyltransferase (sialic acid O-acetyltransferase NeuD family)